MFKCSNPRFGQHCLPAIPLSKWRGNFAHALFTVVGAPRAQLFTKWIERIQDVYPWSWFFNLTISDPGYNNIKRGGCKWHALIYFYLSVYLHCCTVRSPLRCSAGLRFKPVPCLVAGGHADNFSPQLGYQTPRPLNLSLTITLTPLCFASFYLATPSKVGYISTHLATPHPT